MTTQSDSKQRLLFVVLAAVLGLAVTFAIGAAAADRASAQGICDQYPTLPQCQQGEEPIGGGGGGGQGPGGDQPGEGQDLGPQAGAAGPGAAAQAPTGAATGKLPFTGYPVTPLLLLLLFLLVAGLTLRAYLALRDRFRERSDTPSGTA